MQSLAHGTQKFQKAVTESLDALKDDIGKFELRVSDPISRFFNQKRPCYLYAEYDGPTKV